MATLDRLAPPTSTPIASAWKPRRAIAVAFVAATVIALLQVLQSSSFANTGQKMQRLEAERADRTAQVHQLESEVAALSSLDRTERAARDRLGMVPARRTDFVVVNVEAPSGPLLPRPILNPAEDVPVKTDHWWQSLFKALPLP